MATTEECANPLLLGFLKEWWDVAKERNSKGATTYKKAYESMKACPLTFSHPSEAQQLHGLGPKLCDRLAEELKKHCAANGLPMPKKSRKRQSVEGPEIAGVAAPPPKKPRKPKPYVPAFRSGPYAIILALGSLDEDSDQRLTKSEIIDRAQEHCDSSFSAPSEPGKFYTAWSSMKTLEDKDLVHAKGRPARRYALTEEGWEVAHRMQSSVEGHRAAREVNDPQPLEDALIIQPAILKAPEEEIPISTSWNDFVDLGDDSDDVYTHAGQNVNQRTISARGVILEGTGRAGQKIGGAPAGKFDTFAPAEKRQRSQARNFFDISSSPEPESTLRSVKPVSERGPNTVVNVPSHTTGNSAKPSKEGRDHITKEIFPRFEPIELQPGTFSVQLVLDSREVRAKEDRDYIQKELIKKGIRPEVRALELGDIFWVAKCNDPSLLSRYGEEGDEVALDWIVERKRLDDLIGSVKDGRFYEQKFRLRRSGAMNVVYLIEDITLSSEQATKYHEMMESAIASTQVVDGYFVKRTAKLDDTIRYLARMTVMLKSIYESKPLYVIPTTLLDSTTYLPLLNHLRTTHTKAYNITYPSFASLASKSDSLTLRDVYLKMLMCIRGVSGEKAIEIQKLWPTPKALVDAFRQCQGLQNSERMIEAKLGSHPVGRRKIGRQLSSKIAGVWHKAQ